MKVQVNKLLIYLIFIFPLSTVTSSIPVVGTIINKVLFVMMLALLFYGLIRSGLSRKEWLVLILLAVTYVYDCFVTQWPLRNPNELFYFGTWVIFLMYVKKKYNYIRLQIFKNVKLLKWMIVIWEVIVCNGFVVPSCYEGLHSYSAFAGSAHRMDASALIILASILFYYRYSNYKKRIWFLLIIPSIAIFLSGVRTYLVLLGLVLIVLYYYANINHPQRFYATVIPIIVILVSFVVTSSIMQQRMELMEADSKYFDSQGYNALTGITSGRSTFWLIDLYHYWLSPFINKILGNGFNFVRDVNATYYTAPLWAHNDFINIICCNGVIGLFLYFRSYISLSRMIRKSNKQSWILIVGFHLICMFNAMFNMLYTYFAATLAIPILLIAIFESDFLPINKKTL